jgi:Lon protease-like protein
MSKYRELPLFPLNTVLFPGMILPLHIFEPRYKLMIGECIKENRPFGVVLIREGVEVGGEAVPYSVGTTAHVTQMEPLDDGRMQINSVGYQRFKIHNVRRDKPYLVGLIEDFPLEDEDSEEAAEVASQVANSLRRYLQLLASANPDLEALPLDSLPDDGAALAFLTAIVLQLPLDEKQNLLETDNLVTMLRVEQDLLRRELMLVDHMIRQRRPPEDSASPFSLN